MRMNKYFTREFPPLKLSKKIFIFFDGDLEISSHLKYVSIQLFKINSCWSIQGCNYNPPLTNSAILRKINSHYCKYDKVLDKLCIINNNSVPITNTKLVIKYFPNIACFDLWLDSFKQL